jgi:hypothetical protein
MSSAIDKLRAILARATDTPNSAFKRFTATTGIPVMFDPLLPADQAELEAELAPFVAAHDLPALTQKYATLFASKATFANGYRKYLSVHHAMMQSISSAEYDPQLCEALLPIYVNHWLTDKTSPTACGLLADAMINTGYAYRGSSYAADVSDAQWAMLIDFCRQARQILDKADPATREQNRIWTSAKHAYTFIACGVSLERPGDLADTFEAAVATDPLEMRLYDNRVNQLLPRWFGSYEAIEVFARQSMSRTGAAYGTMLYARIYDSIADVEPLDQTLMDYELLKASFWDWFERFPSQALANRFAAHADRQGDVATLRTLFNGYISEIQPHVWFGERQPLAAWDAAFGATARRVG